MDKIKSKIYVLLRKSESFFKTDMVYLAKGGFWGIISQISLVSMSFGIAIAFAHLVPKETYGNYKYILSIISLLTTVSLTGLGTAVLQSVSNGFEGTIKYAFWKNIKWSILFFIGSGIISIYYFLNGNTVLAISMLIAGCLWPFFNSTNLYTSLLIAKKDFRRITIYFDIIGNLFPYFCLFITMFLTKNPVWFVSIYIISNTLIGFILYTRIVSIYKPNEKIDPNMLNYSKHLSAIGILNSIADNIDQLLVFHYVGAVQLAIYNFATAIPDQIKGPIKNLTNLIFPKFAERSEKDIHSGMTNKFIVLFFVTLLMAGGYIIIAPYIYKIFFPKYIDSILYSQIFSLSLLSFSATPAYIYLSVKKKIRELYILNTSVAILQIIIVFISILKWGVLGLIIARVLMRTISAIIGIIFYKISSRKQAVNLYQ
ncbi:MAG: oligosaccharide flippase family protein [Minisyncoccota bacterium]